MRSSYPPNAIPQNSRLNRKSNLVFCSEFVILEPWKFIIGIPRLQGAADQVQVHAVACNSVTRRSAVGNARSRQKPVSDHPCRSHGAIDRVGWVAMCSRLSYGRCTGTDP